MRIIAMRAVELSVQGRDDPRLLVATKRRATDPGRIAGLLAGLANAAAGRPAVLLLGVRGRQVVGLDEVPDAEWWESLRDHFTGPVLELTSTTLDFDGTRVLAIAPERVAASDAGPGVRVLAGWVQRFTLRDSRIVVWRGLIDLEVDAIAGRIDDAACSASLVVPGRPRPVELDTQLHPVDHHVGVVRHDDGIEVRPAFGARLYLAAASRVDDGDGEAESGALQLVLAVPAPGSDQVQVWSRFVQPDPGSGDPGDRWLVRP